MAESSSFSPDTADAEDRSSPPPQDARRSARKKLCRFFQQGRCVFGDRCWNSHIVQVDADATSEQPKRSVGVGTSPDEPIIVEHPPFQPEIPQRKRDKYKPKFSTLSKNSPSKQDTPSGDHPPNWADAPEFVPKTMRSYADTLRSNHNLYNANVVPVMELCPYFADGECPYESECLLIHGELCDICQKACLNPYDEDQRKMHTELCEKEMEKDMELSFAVQRSRDKQCGICMDIVMEKEPMSERRFGILEKCNHTFCLACIRQWRKIKSFESNVNQIGNALDPVVTRACPECRVASDFITPSQFWMETEEEKAKLISDYKVALSKKHCKFFKQGKGTCPFAGACFYLHAKPDGTKVELPPPVRRRRQNQDGELDFVGGISLWDFLEFRDDNLLMIDELDDLGYQLQGNFEYDDDLISLSELL